jgi:hypothetical protein
MITTYQALDASYKFINAEMKRVKKCLAVKRDWLESFLGPFTPARPTGKSNSDIILTGLLVFCLTYVTTEPDGPKAQRDAMAAARYRRNNADMVMLSRRQSTFHAQGRKAGIVDPLELQD